METSQEIEIIKIPDLLEIAARNPNASIPLYNPITGRVERILVSTLIAGMSVNIPWLIDETYDINEIREWNNKFWKSLQNNNIGHQPYEDLTWWTEVSASLANGGSMSNWAAGLFTVTPVCVVENNTIYVLDESVAPLPFESINFETERLAGYWLSGSTDLSNYVKRTGESLPQLPPKRLPLYNGHAAVSNICPTGFRLPTNAEMITLSAFGGGLKESGLDFWQSPNTGGTNATGFNAKGNGARSSTYDYGGEKQTVKFATSYELGGLMQIYTLSYNTATLDSQLIPFKSGISIRCIKNDNVDPTAPILDASGNIYNWVRIGSQIWLTTDLIATRDNDNNLIPNILDFATWQGLTTPALCYYNNEQQPPTKKMVYDEAGKAWLKDEDIAQQETTVDNGAAYDDSIIYDVSALVVYSNPLSLDPQFQVPQLYTLTVSAGIAGVSPEDSPYIENPVSGNWFFNGQAVSVTRSTANIHTTGGSAAVKSLTGYKHGDSYLLSNWNTCQKFDQFSTDDIIGIKPNDIPIGGAGRWVEDATWEKNNIALADITAIRNFRNPAAGSTVICETTGFIYRFQLGTFVDNGTTILIPTYRFQNLDGAFIKVGSIPLKAENTDVDTGTNDTLFMSVAKSIYAITTRVFSGLTTDVKTIQGAINWLNSSKAMQNPGISQRTPVLPIDIVIDPVANTLTIATVKGGETISASNPVIFNTDGSGIINEWIKTGPVVFPNFTNTYGVWFFHVDNSGAPISTQVSWYDFAIISSVYRFLLNDTLSDADKIVVRAYECHSNADSASDHAWKHARGTQNINGFDYTANIIASNTSGIPNSAPNADGRNTCFSLAGGTNSDDGLEYTVVNSVVNAKFNQDLGILTAASLTSSNSGLFKVRTNDSGGKLFFLPATRFPFPFSASTNRPEFITALGVRTEVANNRWMVTYAYALQDDKQGEAIKICTSETDFTTYALARDHNWATLQGLFSTLRDKELRPLWQIIHYVKHSGAGNYVAGCKYAALVSMRDIRNDSYANYSSALSAQVLAANVVTTSTTLFPQTDLSSRLLAFESLFRKYSAVAWVATDTTLTLVPDTDKDFATGTPTAIITTVTITLTAQVTGFSAHYWFKFKAGAGWGFVWPAGYAAAISGNDAIVAGSIYEVDFFAGVYIIKLAA